MTSSPPPEAPVSATTPPRAGTTLEALSRATLPTAHGAMSGPRPKPSSTRIVHLGLGAFSRAHQLVFTELAAEQSGDDSWGVLGVTGRRAEVRDRLLPQDGVYGVLFRGAGGDTHLRLVGSLTGVAAASETSRVVAAIADPAVEVVTMTVTEKAYDVTSTPMRLLDAGLRARWAASAAAVTLLSCDNLVGNGRTLLRLLSTMAETTASTDYRAWLLSAVRCPDSMVDRIVPATTTEDQAAASSISGRTDAGLVVAEPYGSWIIQDDFAAGRPRWELAGAVFTADVGPFESAKLHLLNATHSLLAYGGLLRGHRTIADAVRDPDLLGQARGLQAEARGILPSPPGVDLAAYSEEILQRFHNTALQHTTRQVAADGSQKIPIRLLPIVRRTLQAGRIPHGAIGAIAAWMVVVARSPADTLQDPLAPELLRALGGERSDAAAIVRALSSVDAVFDGLLTESAAVAAALETAVGGLLAAERLR